MNILKKGKCAHHLQNKNSKTGLKLGGIKIPFSKLIGHSDADVVLHAICDSIFGALSMRDIGYHFPNTDKKWKNANSSKFVYYCRKKLEENKFHILNLDVNIVSSSYPISNSFNQTLMYLRSRLFGFRL